MYILRPEAAESMFVLHSLTGHPVFRQWVSKRYRQPRSRCDVNSIYLLFLIGLGNVRRNRPQLQAALRLRLLPKCGEGKFDAETLWIGGSHC